MATATVMKVWFLRARREVVMLFVFVIEVVGVITRRTAAAQAVTISAAWIIACWARLLLVFREQLTTKRTCSLHHLLLSISATYDLASLFRV